MSKAQNNAAGQRFVVRCSYLAVADEKVHDLLSSDPRAACEVIEAAEGSRGSA